MVAVFTADDLGDYWKPGPLLVSPPPIERLVFHERTQVPLARDKVRHAGEPLAVVIADSRYLAINGQYGAHGIASFCIYISRHLNSFLETFFIKLI